MVAVGSVFRATLDVYNEAGVLANPGTHALAIKLPNGAAVPGIIVSPPTDTGKLFYDYTTTVEGRHSGVWTTTAPGIVQPFTFYVDAAESQSIIALGDAKRILNIPSAVTDSDMELLMMLDVATEVVEGRIGAVLTRQIEEKVESAQCLLLTYGPPQSIVSIEPWLPNVGGETVAAVDVVLDKETWTVERATGWPFNYGPYKVVYTIGRPTIKASIRHAAAKIITYLWETQRGPSQLGPVDPLDDETFAVQGRIWSIPRDVMELLANDDLGPMVA